MNLVAQLSAQGVPVVFVGSNLAQNSTLHGAIATSVQIFFEDRKQGIRELKESWYLTPFNELGQLSFSDTQELAEQDIYTTMPPGFNPEAPTANLPLEALDPDFLKPIAEQVLDFVYHTVVLPIKQSGDINVSLANFTYKSNTKLTQAPTESDVDFASRLEELKQAEFARAKQKLASKQQQELDQLERKLASAEQKLERENAQAKQAGVQTLISLGATVLSSLFGKKRINSSSLSRATTTARSYSRQAKEKEDVAVATTSVEELKQALTDLSTQNEAQVIELKEQLEQQIDQLQTVELRPLKRDIKIVKSCIAVF